MFKDEDDFHASAFVLGPDDTVILIRDMRKEQPLWKFPGGKKQLLRPFGKKHRGEQPIETLIREVKEETGIWLRKSRTIYLATVDQGNHNKHVFFSQINSTKHLKPLSKEYEEARRFKIDELLWLPDMHPTYRHYFTEYILPNIDSLRAG